MIRPARRLAVLACAAVLLAAACGGGLPPLPGQPTGTPAPAASGPNTGQPAGVRFTRTVIRDPAADNVDALVFLAPSGWHAQGSVTWLPEWARVAQINTRVEDPASGLVIEWLPVQDFIWFQPPAGFEVPTWSNYQGKQYVAPISDPAEFVSNFWGPGPLSHLQGATLVGVDQVPALAAEFVRFFGAPADAAAYRLRYEFDANGRRWQEEVNLALLFATANGITSWYVNFAYAVRAPQGELDRQRGVISTIVASPVSTPEWEGIYRLVQRLFYQGIQQQMADTVAFGRLLAQHRAESEALQDQVRQEREASADHIADLRGEILAGVDTYRDPFRDELVQLPSTWDTYWVSDSGDYFVTDQPNADPAREFGGNWQILQQAP